VYEFPGNDFDIQCNKSISSCAAASGEQCPSLHRRNSRNALGYKDLYTRKMEAGCSRSDNKNSMTDSIENIQERTAGAMSVASAGLRLAAGSASTSKRGVLV